MNLLENPIFLTQKRLVHRAGVLAPILLAAVVGLSLLGGLIAYTFDPLMFDLQSVADAGKAFYTWVIIMQGDALLCAVAKTAQTVAEERKAGLFDSNRLTPLRPSEIVAGYWLRSPLGEFYITVVLGAIGLAMILVGGLPIGLWLGTQMLIFGTALVLGLFAVLAGMTMQKALNTFLVLLFFALIFAPFAFTYPKINLVNFLLPIYALLNLLWHSGAEPGRVSDWIGWPMIFGQSIPPVLLTLLLQAILGLVSWRTAVRNAASPVRPMPRWGIVAIFAFLVWAQHGLTWTIWRGQWPAGNTLSDGITPTPLAAVHACTIVLGAAVLAIISPDPQQVRLDLLRAGSAKFSLLLGHSAVPFAFALTAIAGTATATHIVSSWSEAGNALAIAVGSLLACLLSFSLMLELCRLQFKQAALSFFAFGLFVLWVLPLVLTCLFPNHGLGNFSLISPGIAALTESYVDVRPPEPANVLFAHMGLVALLCVAWVFRWRTALANLRSESGNEHRRVAAK